MNVMNRSSKLSGHEQVVEFLNKFEHPLKPEIEEVRRIILEANDQLSEHIKWNAPSFCVNKKDRITFNFHGKKGFRLVFHCGSKKTEFENRAPIMKDDTGILNWVTGDRATLTIATRDDLKERKSKLIKVISKWIEVTKDI